MSELHEAHPGIVRMKALARSYVWWPGMDKDLEHKVRDCRECQEHQKAPAGVPMHPWEYPPEPWRKLHVYYAGRVGGMMILILVDAYSKWIEAILVHSATSTATIEELRDVFWTHGLPEVVVSDNGTCFTSGEFRGFLKQNGVQRRTSPHTVLHPVVCLRGLCLETPSGPSCQDSSSTIASHHRQ